MVGVVLGGAGAAVAGGAVAGGVVEGVGRGTVGRVVVTVRRGAAVVCVVRVAGDVTVVGATVVSGVTLGERSGSAGLDVVVGGTVDAVVELAAACDRALTAIVVVNTATAYTLPTPATTRAFRAAWVRGVRTGFTLPTLRFRMQLYRSRPAIVGILLLAALIPPALAADQRAAAPTAQSMAGPSSPTPPGSSGYWMLASDGGIFSFGAAAFEGSAGRTRLSQPMVGMLPTPTGRGYWLASADGGVFSFGDAPFLGSAVNRPPGAAPIVAIVGTPTGGGYWLVASDASVYTLGDATYRGRPPPAAVHAPIVGAAATPSGQGYYLAAADGSVYPEGDAYVLGDASQVHLARPIVAMATTPDGTGYWLVASDGGIFTYGSAAFAGSTGAIRLNRPIVGMAATTEGAGYWLFASDGGVFAFGGAPFLGSTGGLRLVRPVVAARIPPAVHGTGVAIFYYPWYATAAHDGAVRHWDEGGHTPPDDIGSDYYPARGAYSSSDPAVVESHMGDLAATGIDEAVVSWWGRGSYEDKALAGVITAAGHHGVSVGVQVEPYDGRNAASVAADFAYLKSLGITDIWVYQADLLTPSDWVVINDAVSGVRTMAESGNVSFVKHGGLAQWARQSHFTGIYIYDAINYEGRDDVAFCGSARAYGLVCAPVAAPGFIAVRATNATYGRSRENGFTYDRRWMGALGSRPDVVAITSYNEWHEGSQIEPAVPKCLGPSFCYRNYEGAWGTSGQAATFSYLNRTGYWTSLLRGSNP